MLVVLDYMWQSSLHFSKKDHFYNTVWDYGMRQSSTFRECLVVWDVYSPPSASKGSQLPNSQVIRMTDNRGVVSISTIGSPKKHLQELFPVPGIWLTGSNRMPWCSADHMPWLSGSDHMPWCFRMLCGCFVCVIICTLSFTFSGNLEILLPCRWLAKAAGAHGPFMMISLWTLELQSS